MKLIICGVRCTAYGFRSSAQIIIGPGLTAVITASRPSNYNGYAKNDCNGSNQEKRK